MENLTGDEGCIGGQEKGFVLIGILSTEIDLNKYLDCGRFIGNGISCDAVFGQLVTESGTVSVQLG
ncbi:MAG: hypothetical protein ABJH63_01405 [Rhizobiaceae bacterium]